MKGLRIAHLNIQGLATSYNGLFHVFANNPEIDVLTLSETHIIQNSTDDTDSLYDIPNYTFIKRNRTAWKGGGVAIYIRNGLNWKRRQDLENESIESLWIEFYTHKAKKFLIASCYRPPNGSNYLSQNYTEFL